MKGGLTKSLSSPGRTEKFQTPLMLRFLRSNVSSRSRGSSSRSRSSPMFIFRTNTNKKNGGNPNPVPPINDTLTEPSSPKVTCIGQVRVKRSSKNSKHKKNSQQCCCYNNLCSSCCSCSCCGCGGVFLPRIRLCCNFSPRFRKPTSICNYLRKWVSFFRFGYCKKVDTREDSSSRFGGSNFRNGHIEDNNGERRNVIKDELVGEIKEGFLQMSSSCCTPPKNALLLTRCRSAPYRSSSLASRFWSSPLREAEAEAETETTPKNEAENDEEIAGEEGGMGRHVSPNLENEEEAESRNGNNHEEDEENEEMGNSRNGKSIESIHPLILTRCKSEPARTGERLMNPEANFLLTQRRSDTAQSCLNLPQINCD